jgi:hypothetical protein
MFCAGINLLIVLYFVQGYFVNIIQMYKNIALTAHCKYLETEQLARLCKTVCLHQQLVAQNCLCPSENTCANAPEI